jgi:hypothetical protein
MLTNPRAAVEIVRHVFPVSPWFREAILSSDSFEGEESYFIFQNMGVMSIISATWTARRTFVNRDILRQNHYYCDLQ